MILKSFELSKIDSSKNSIFLIYGQNEGLKNEITKKYFTNKFKGDILKYDEKEILDNKSDFFNGILSRSFFEDNKLYIVSRVTDKFYNIVEEIIEKGINDITVVLNSGVLEKKTKLRKLFEKDKDIICIPVYEDNFQSLSAITRDFFRLNKITISQEIINLIVI